MIADTRLEQARLRRHRIAPEEIAHIDFADVLDVRLAGDQLLEFGHGLHMHAQGLERAQDFAPAPARERRQRQQDAVDVAVLDQRRQMLRRIHFDAVDHAAVQAAVIVDEHQWIEGARGRQHGRQSRPGFARSVDSDARHRRLNVAGQQGSSVRQTATRRHTEARNTSRSPRRSTTARADANSDAQKPEQQTAQRHGECDGEHGLVSEEANDRAVQAQPHESRNTDGDHRDIGAANR